MKKQISLTVHVNHPYGGYVKRWEKFNRILHYWFKHREDGPAWITDDGVIYYTSGSISQKSRRYP